MILQLKDGVVLHGNKYINKMLEVLQIVYRRHEWAVTISSGRDSHVTGYHPQDRALDARVVMIPEARREKIAAEIRAELPFYYDVVYEPEVMKDGKVVKGAHFHIEADAKKEQAV